jgi:Cd2+/Zn2+-exporting ATPase
MTEKTIEIAISGLLPEVEDDQDGCIKRLESSLQSRRGFSRVHVNRDNSPVGICLHYDPAVVSEAEVEQAAKRAAAGILTRYHHRRFDLEGLDCSDCALVVEHSLGRLDGVLKVNVSFENQRLDIEFDSQKTNENSIQKRVNLLGYHVISNGPRELFSKNEELILSLASGITLGAGWLGSQFHVFPYPIALGFYLGAFAFGGYHVTRHGLQAVRERRFDIDLLMVIAAFGAAVLGDFAEGALLLFLFSLGHALEEYALDKARNAVRSLENLTPKKALVRRDGEEISVPVEKLQIGEIVVVKPGVRIPVDGEITLGHSGIDQSSVTGESISVEKGPGAPVFAGSLNGDGALEVRVTRLARDSTLSQVMKMVEAAQAQKSPTERITEKFSSYFVPAVLIVDLLLIAIPPLFGEPFGSSFLRAMTLLVAASPCALVLGTPAAILAGIAQAARNGVLIKGGAHLENLGRLRAIAFDKTGTLTRGEPEITDIIPFSKLSKSDLLLKAAAIEDRSAHPFAPAFLKAASLQQLSLSQSDQVVSISGRGLTGLVDGEKVWVGNPSLFSEHGFEINKQIQSQLEELQKQGKSVVLVSVDTEICGVIAIADILREDAGETLTEIRGLGIHRNIILSGDNVQTAARIAAQLGVSDYRAELMPSDKLDAVKELVQQHQIVAMVGDGVNDAPALANATVGIALGGAGTDVALKTADVVLMASELRKLPFSIGLGRATHNIIRQNLIIAFGVIFVLSGFSLAGLAGIGAAILLHESSTLVVILNALRLLYYQEKVMV